MMNRPRIALLSNPKSTGNIAQLPRIRAFCSDHPDIFHYEVEHAHQVGEALRTIARIHPKVLVINGGDGTVQAALTELHNNGHFGDSPPPVAVLPSGKTNLIALDLGASTGGFTDCLLQARAKQVFAVDVGQGQLAWKLRRDRRVVVMEKTNARHLTPDSFPKPFAPFELIVADCSFISLRKILPAAVALLKTGGKIVALIKPQFEAGKAEADRGAGVIRDPAVHERVLNELREFVAAQPGLKWQGVTESPLLGPAGNKEFLTLIEKLG